MEVATVMTTTMACSKDSENNNKGEDGAKCGNDNLDTQNHSRPLEIVAAMTAVVRAVVAAGFGPNAALVICGH